MENSLKYNDPAGNLHKLNFFEVKKACIILRSLNHPLRQKMLQLLKEDPGLCVMELQELMTLDQSVASQHLAILRMAHIVKTKREGKKIRYFINEREMMKIQQVILMIM